MLFLLPSYETKATARKTGVFLIAGTVVAGLIGLNLLQPTVTSATSGMSITPSVSNISLTNDQATYQTTLMITNQTKSRATLHLTTQDFGALDEGGGILFLGTSPNTTWDSHRLSSWISVAPQHLQLAPGQQAGVTVKISNEASLTPGGHYAAIIATLVSPESASHVAVNQSLSSLLFVNKIGGATFGIDIQKLQPNTAWWGQVEGARITVANTGNTHIIPRGSISLHGPFGQIISQGTLNAPSSIILPHSHQTFPTTMSSQNVPLWPGNYTLVLAYRYDGTDTIHTTQQHIFSLGIVGLATLVVGGCASIAWIIRRLVHLNNQ